MKTASVIVLIAIVLIVGNTMNRACKSGYHAWCAPMSTLVRHHTKIGHPPDCEGRPCTLPTTSPSAF
jgi:hypothetical protein